MKVKKISLIIILIIAVIILTGCGTKAISVEEFKTKMEENGFTVSDISEQFAAIANKTYVASKAEGYQVEFYEFDSVENATNSFEDNKRLFESVKQDSDKETFVNTNDNVSKYTLESEDRYMLVSKVNNTCIYADINLEYKDELDSILQEINY